MLLIVYTPFTHMDAYCLAFNVQRFAFNVQPSVFEWLTFSGFNVRNARDYDYMLKKHNIIDLRKTTRKAEFEFIVSHVLATFQCMIKINETMFGINVYKCLPHLPISKPIIFLKRRVACSRSYCLIMIILLLDIVFFCSRSQGLCQLTALENV